MRAGRVVGAMASAGVLMVVGASAAAGVEETPRWRLVKTVEPEYSKGFSALYQVLAMDASHAFAFGQGSEFSDVPSDDLLAYRYDGETWRHTTLPPKLGNLLGPVGAAGPSAVFAVAQFKLPEAPLPPRERYYSSTLVRWNGSKWSAVRKWRGYDLQSMAVLGRKNVWVFGSRLVKGRFRPVALHFNGGSWKIRSAPASLSRRARRWALW